MEQFMKYNSKECDDYDNSIESVPKTNDKSNPQVQNNVTNNSRKNITQILKLRVTDAFQKNNKEKTCTFLL
jgi:hypothetical protein